MFTASSGKTKQRYNQDNQRNWGLVKWTTDELNLCTQADIQMGSVTACQSIYGWLSQVIMIDTFLLFWMSVRKAWNEAQTKFGMASNHSSMHMTAEEKISHHFDFDNHSLRKELIILNCMLHTMFISLCANIIWYSEY